MNLHFYHTKSLKEKNMIEQDLIKLLKSGNFTIAYHDNQAGCVYRDRIDDYDKLPSPVDGFDSWMHEEGYLPYIVKMLVKALGGKALSI